MSTFDGTLGVRVRPAAFDSYASRIGWNLFANLAPGDEDSATASGGGALRDLLAALYAEVYVSPEAWGLPRQPIIEDDPRSRQTAPRQKLQACLRALWVLGQRATLVDDTLRADRAVWEEWVAEAKPATVRALLAALQRASLEIQSSDPVIVRGDRYPGALTALAGLAVATAQARDGLARFLLGDTRAVSGHTGWHLEDVLRSLEQWDVAAARRLDAFATSLGCKRQVTPPTVWWDEYRSTYTHRKAHKALCGFVVQEGTLALRTIHDDTAAILPTALAQDPAVRAWFLERARCQQCGGCADRGPLRIKVEGQEHALCHSCYGGGVQPPYEHMDGVEALILAQLERYQVRQTQGT